MEHSLGNTKCPFCNYFLNFTLFSAGSSEIVYKGYLGSRILKAERHRRDHLLQPFVSSDEETDSEEKWSYPRFELIAGRTSTNLQVS